MPEAFAFKLDGRAITNSFMVHFPMTTESGVPLIGENPPKMQVQFTIGTKKILLDLDPAKWIKDKKISGIGEL